MIPEKCDQKTRSNQLLDGGTLLLRGHLLFFRHSCRSGNNDAEETDDDPTRMIRPEEVPNTSDLNSPRKWVHQVPKTAV